MNRVLIIEAQIKQYRLPFYELLVERLREKSIELQVAYSDPSAAEASKKDNCDLPDYYGKKVNGYWLLREKLLFQPLLFAAVRADLVIVDQGNKFLLNHILLPLSHAGIKRVAFWGLGENRQDGRWPLSEWYRRKTLNWVSWWFAYTKGTARYLTENGVPGAKITAVDNAVDTTQLRKQVGSISPEERLALREALQISSTASVGIFCGMLDKVKGLPFLLEAAKNVRRRVPEFHLILVGGGPEQRHIQAAVQGIPWIHFMGPCFAEEKSKLIAVSDAFLMPGRVGLVILDAFAAGLPLLSTRLKIHGPEIEYLEEGTNGLLSEPEVLAFADMVSSLLLNPEALARLQHGAWESGAKYTIDNMVANFELGIRQCLGTAARSAAAPEIKNCELVDR
jgi:glycosyltransferase involved in cell wall biosynthesis